MTTATKLSYSSIDDYLGPGEARFFSHGYRSAEYQIGDIVIAPANDLDPDVAAAVSVRYPRDWSKKKADVDLRPHLSSVDMLVLGTQLSETYLSHAYSLDEAMRRRMWLRRVTLKAGSAPQEDLEAIQACATHRETKAIPGEANRFVSVFDCQVGRMQARCEIEHEISRQVTADKEYPTIEDILGSGVSRYYGDGFKLRHQLIEDVRVDMGALQSDATVQIEQVQECRIPNDGIEGAYQPCVSMIDCFVANLQMAQVMMYEMDAVTRRDSNTLWMIRTVIQAESPHRPYTAPLAAHTRVTGKHLLKLRGNMWRSTDIAGGLGAISLRCSLAHELPTGFAAAAA